MLSVIDGYLQGRKANAYKCPLTFSAVAVLVLYQMKEGRQVALAQEFVKVLEVCQSRSDDAHMENIGAAQEVGVEPLQGCQLN